MKLDSESVIEQHYRHPLASEGGLFFVCLGILVVLTSPWISAWINHYLARTTELPGVDAVPFTVSVPIVVIAGGSLAFLAGLKMLVHSVKRTYILTDSHIMAVYGYPPNWPGSSFFGNAEQCSLDKVKGIDPNDTVLGGLFGYAHLTVKRADSDPIYMAGVPTPYGFLERINDAKESYKKTLYGSD